MIRRSTWILLGVFVLSLLAAWLLQSSPFRPVLAAATPAPDLQKPLLQGIPSQDLTSLQIHTSTGEQVQLTRNAKGVWTLGDHPDLPVDQGKVEELVSELTAMTAVTTLNNPPGLQQLGLAPAAAAITLTGARGARKVIQAGSETPTGSGYYVQVDADPPVVVNKESIDRVFTLFHADALVIVTPTLAGTGTASVPAPAASITAP